MVLRRSVVKRLRDASETKKYSADFDWSHVKERVRLPSIARQQ
jgi:hypothetical protein